MATLDFGQILLLQSRMAEELTLVTSLPPSNPVRRIMVRVLFSLFDAFLHGLKQHALAAHTRGEVTFTEKQLAHLREAAAAAEQERAESSDPIGTQSAAATAASATRTTTTATTSAAGVGGTDDSEAADPPGPRFLSAKKNIRLALKCYAKARGAEVPAKVTTLFDRFTKGVGIRNRLTHPKSAEDLDLSAEDGWVLRDCSEMLSTLLLWSKDIERARIDAIEAEGSASIQAQIDEITSYRTKPDPAASGS